MDLKSHRFISYFEPEQAAQLCKLAALESFPDGAVIFEEGEIPDFLYLVLKGQVTFSKRIGPERYQTVAVAWENDFFGEFGVLDGQPRSARAVAFKEAILAKIPRDKLMEILQNVKGSVVLNLFGYITQHLRVTTEQYVNQIVQKEKMALVGEMVNTIMHDFKGPFTGIQLASSMLRDLHPDEETAEWCDLIQMQSQRMLAMADEVLEFARGTAILKKEPVNLERLIQRFEKLNRIYFDSASVKFSTQVENVEVMADENKILRVLQNLINNAVEAFENRGGRIELVVRAVENWAEIKISDNGPGIPQVIWERLFEPFITYGKRGGTGLGTAIAKSIIDAHGGEISFHSQSGEGTTFYIRLPLIKVMPKNPQRDIRGELNSTGQVFA